MTTDPLNEALKRIPKWMLKCPVAFEWWYYDDVKIFAGINYERSVSAKKPMIDIHYCATKALNGVVLKTVQYDKKRFKNLKEGR
jgi:hypothetical protein